MEKKKTYTAVRFSADVLQEANREICGLVNHDQRDKIYYNFRVEHDDASWKYDNVDEFISDYRRFNGYACFNVHLYNYDLDVTAYLRDTIVSISAPSRPEIEKVFDVFEKNILAAKLPPLPEPPEPDPQKIEPVIFIGHGQSPQWKDLKDHLQDKHGYKVEAYETGARAGHTIRDILEEMVLRSSFALLVFTGEDEQADGGLRARQNVVHEAGLFQGKLGFPRAIMLFENGVEDFSNVAGIQQIRFSKSNIKETFGEVLATLKREFDR